MHVSKKYKSHFDALTHHLDRQFELHPNRTTFEYDASDPETDI